MIFLYYNSENLIIWRAKDKIEIAVKTDYGPEFEDGLFDLIELSVEEAKIVLEKLKEMLE